MAEPNGQLLARVDDLVKASARVEAELTADREAREAEKVALEQRMRTNRWTARIAVVVGIIGLVVGYQGNRRADDIIAARTNSGVVACQNANDQSAKQHQLWDGLLMLPRAQGSAPPDPATLAQFHALLDQTFPTRDCSPAAVDAFYNGGSK